MSYTEFKTWDLRTFQIPNSNSDGVDYIIFIKYKHQHQHQNFLRFMHLYILQCIMCIFWYVGQDDHFKISLVW